MSWGGDLKADASVHVSECPNCAHNFFVGRALKTWAEGCGIYCTDVTSDDTKAVLSTNEMHVSACVYLSSLNQYE